MIFDSITKSSAHRVCEALTPVGMSKLKAGVREGLTIRQAFHQINLDCKAREIESKAREKQEWIDSGCLRHATLSPREYVELLGESAVRRWGAFTAGYKKVLLKNWQSKTVEEAAAKYVEKEWSEWAAGDRYTNVFKGGHIDAIEKAIEYGFPYSAEAQRILWYLIDN